MKITSLKSSIFLFSSCITCNLQNYWLGHNNSMLYGDMELLRRASLFYSKHSKHSYLFSLYLLVRDKNWGKRYFSEGLKIGQKHVARNFWGRTHKPAILAFYSSTKNLKYVCFPGPKTSSLCPKFFESRIDILPSKWTLRSW